MADTGILRDKNKNDAEDQLDARSETSTIMSKSRSTLRRELQRKKQLVVSAQRETSEPKAKDAAVQCDIMTEDAMIKLQNQLTKDRLRLVIAKGKLASMRRKMGTRSDCSSISDASSAEDADGFQSSKEEEPEENDDYEEEWPESEARPSTADAESESLDDNLEVGDVACICGLTSERGRALNELYGKLENYNAETDRFGVRLKCGLLVAIKSDNLEIGVKKEKLSDEDEQSLMGLVPTPETVRMLPYMERMKALYGNL